MIHLNRGALLKIVLAVAVLSIVSAIVLLVFYWVTNGRLVVEPLQGVQIKSISYCSLQCTNLNTTEDNNSAIAPAGDYIVRISLKNETSYVTNITLKGFFATTTVSAKSFKYDFSARSNNGMQHTLPLQNGFLAYNTDGVPTTIDTSFEPSARPLAAAMRVNNQQILLVYGTTFRAESVKINATATLYNQTSRAATQLGDIEGDVSSSNILYGQGVIYILQGKSITKISAEGVSHLELPDSISYAKNGDLPIVAVSTDVVAVLSGNDFAYDEDSVAPTASSVITIYSTKDFSKIGQFEIGKRNDILGLSLSPNNTSVVAVGSSSLITYNIKTGENTLSVPAVTTDSNSLIWKNDSSYVYQEGIGGLYMANLSAREAFSLVDSSVFRINYLSCIVNDSLYLTGSSIKGSSGYRTGSNTYIVDLASTGGNTTTISESSVVRALPLSGPGFDVGYRLNGVNTTLTVNADERSHTSAIRSVYEMGYDPAEYTFEFSNYTNPFKESW